MGHLPIVNLETIKNVISEGCISTRGNLNEMIENTTANILSDVLATRKGDLIFPWIVKGETGGNVGFKYIFKVDGPPVFVNGEKYPVKVPLARVGYEFKEPLPESEALDLWDKKLLWNAIGKKSLGRGRSLSHQLPMEDEKLQELLRKVNAGKPKKLKLNEFKKRGQPIVINSKQDQWDEKLKRTLVALSPEERISRLDLSGLPWRRGNRFIYEKTLEAWIMANIDSPIETQLRETILDPKLSIEWFGNYLPFGVAGGNMDVVVIQNDGNQKKVLVIELKVGDLSQGQYEQAAGQVIDYSSFIQRAFKSYGISVDVEPIVLCAKPLRKRVYSSVKGIDAPVKLVVYEIDDSGKVQFEKLI